MAFSSLFTHSTGKPCSRKWSCISDALSRSRRTSSMLAAGAGGIRFGIRIYEWKTSLAKRIYGIQMRLGNWRG